MTLFLYAESVNFHEFVETIQGFASILSNCLINNKKLVANESTTKLMLFTSQIHPVLPDIRFIKNS